MSHFIEIGIFRIGLNRLLAIDLRARIFPANPVSSSWKLVFGLFILQWWHFGIIIVNNSCIMIFIKLKLHRCSVID